MNTQLIGWAGHPAARESNNDSRVFSRSAGQGARWRPAGVCVFAFGQMAPHYLSV